jgi:hypothetical protein
MTARSAAEILREIRVPGSTQEAKETIESQGPRLNVNEIRVRLSSHGLDLDEVDESGYWSTYFIAVFRSYGFTDDEAFKLLLAWGPGFERIRGKK